MNVSQLLNKGYKMIATEPDTTIYVDPSIRQVQYTYYGPPAPVSEEVGIKSYISFLKECLLGMCHPRFDVSPVPRNRTTSKMDQLYRPSQDMAREAAFWHAQERSIHM